MAEQTPYEKKVIELADRLAKAGNSPYMGNMFLEEAKEAIAYAAEMFTKAWLAAHVKFDQDPYEHLNKMLIRNGLIPAPENAAGKSSDK